MSESSYFDPAAPPRGGVRISGPPGFAADAHADAADADTAHSSSGASGGALAKVVGRWWLIALSVALGIVGAFVYLAMASKVYTSRCVIAAEIERGTPAGDVAPDEFLFQQRDVITSSPVLATAATTLISTEHKVRAALDVGVSKGEGVVTISYNAAQSDEAARGANAIADAYLRTRAQQQTSATAGLSELTKQRDELTAARTKQEAAIREIRRTASGSGSDAEKAAAARLEQLQQAMTAAEVEVAGASAAAATIKELLADPQRMRAVIEANRSKGIFDRLEAQRAAVESELAQLGPQLEKQRQSMLPQHPVVVSTQRRIEQAKATLAELDKQYISVYAAHLEQQRATAQKRVDELKQLIAAQSAQAKDSVARAAKIAGLEAELKKTDAAIAAMDGKLRDVMLNSGASAAPTVKVVVPAQSPRRPSSPDRNRTILIAAILGVTAGLALAAVLPRRR